MADEGKAQARHQNSTAYACRPQAKRLPGQTEKSQPLTGLRTAR
jgi:hypothetical protein